MKKIPSFLIVGAHKCGTTSLYKTLAGHPDIQELDVKEPHFFCNRLVKHSINNVVSDYDQYCDLLESASAGSNGLVGEASVFYLYYYAEAIKNIEKYCGAEIKIIICVRNPVERAYSAYMHECSKGRLENMEFIDALKNEENRIANRLYPPSMHYKAAGLYSGMITEYKKTFKNVKIVSLENMTKNPSKELLEIQDFLGVDKCNLGLANENVGRLAWKSHRVGNAIKYLIPNAGRTMLKTYVPKLYSSMVDVALTKLQAKAPKMDETARSYLEEYYVEEIAQLADVHGIVF